MEYLLQEAQEFVYTYTDMGMSIPQSRADILKCGKFLVVEGKTIIDYTRMDYLGMGDSEEIRQLMHRHIQQNDISCPASQIIFKPGSIEKLENAIAEFHGMNAAIIFTCGYSANINIVQALGLRSRSPHLIYYAKSVGLARDTRHIPTVFIYEINSHYSLIHGIRISCKLAPKNC